MEQEKYTFHNYCTSEVANAIGFSAKQVVHGSFYKHSSECTPLHKSFPPLCPVCRPGVSHAVEFRSLYGPVPDTGHSGDHCESASRREWSTAYVVRQTGRSAVEGRLIVHVGRTEPRTLHLSAGKQKSLSGDWLKNKKLRVGREEGLVRLQRTLTAAFHRRMASWSTVA